jgi:hypothetical protein
LYVRLFKHKTETIVKVSNQFFVQKNGEKVYKKIMNSAESKDNKNESILNGLARACFVYFSIVSNLDLNASE